MAANKVPEERCKAYCGANCLDGYCPMALRDEYAEHGCDLISNCDECPYYGGCKDCMFEGTSYCDKTGGTADGSK